MTLMPDPTWQASLDFLRDLHGISAAQVNAITLAQARDRWQHAVIARTSMHDLLFTLPGDGYPFTSSVRVQSANGRYVLLRWENDRLVEEKTAEVETIDALLDTFLERLTSPTLTCRHCGRPVVVSAEQFEVFERMHYNCFHHLFEHDPFDPDEECIAGGCPSASIGPAIRREEPRDSIVEELIDDLAVSKLGAQSAAVRIERRGPGMLAVTFGASTYLISVRAEPRQR
ncbi:hypothetical protein SAMN05421678_118143 [Actinopolymorpha cephalotaxi]|uniref:Uncharacterized protein n=2 Tax=Actinopolymorpha cephalotaxi TaxID=504797 RepID=A0A1I3ABI9_9ACTN|nr:hypothetical protein SAMN05421678_118143 [Actinopolymorpha cephalotaxi]